MPARDSNNPSPLAAAAEASVSELHFVRPASGDRDRETMNRSVVRASSGALGWDGVVCEIGMTASWEENDVASAGHFVTMNIGSEALVLERKTAHGFKKFRMPPGSLWLNPAGADFTQRNGRVDWNALDISVEKVRRVLGRDINLPPFDIVHDEPLGLVMRALAAEVRGAGSSGPLFADGLAIALVSRLARLAGLPPKSIAPRGALAVRSLVLVKEKIESSLAETIRIADLAAVAGLSPAHFAREFRRLTSEPPHTYVMRRRIERAREFLLHGRSIAEVASACGFADQAHLSRHFVRVFGITPGAFVHRQQRCR